MAKKKKPNPQDTSNTPPTTDPYAPAEPGATPRPSSGSSCGSINNSDASQENIINQNVNNTTKQPSSNKVDIQKNKQKIETGTTSSSKPEKIVIGKSVSKPLSPTTVKSGSKKQNLNNNKKGGSGGGGGGGSGGNGSGGGGGGGGASPGLSQNASPHGIPIEKQDECNECKSENSNILFNKVKETESGHVVEFDDSPGSERLHIMHRSGTNFEILPRGSFTGTVVTDGWLSFYRDLWLHVDGFTNITLDKGVKIIVNKDEIKNTKDKNVNLDIKIMGKANVNLHLEGGNLNIKLDDGDVNLNVENGDLNVRTMGNYNHYVDGDYNLQVTGHMHTVIGRDRLEEVTGNKEDFVYEGTYTLDTNKGIKNITKGDMEIQVDGNYKAKIVTDYLLKILGNEQIYIGKRKTEWVDGKTTIKSMEHEHFSEGNYDITSNATQNYYSMGVIRIYGQTNLDLNGTKPDLASRNPQNIAKEKEIIEYIQYKNIENSFKQESLEREN